MTTNLLSVIEQLVGALENHSGNYKLTKSEVKIQEAAIAAGKQALEQTRGEAAPKANMFHDAGAMAQCQKCKRYTLDGNAIGSRDSRQPVCTCGQQHYWSGSFKPPGPDAQWHGPAPTHPQATEPAPKRPPNCGTGHCSCIECVMEPAPSLEAQLRQFGEQQHARLVEKFGEPAPSTAGERVELSAAPCNKCGYNGPGYYQAKTHPCAALLSAPALPVGELTESELMKCIAQAGCFGTVKLSYESGPYDIDRPTLNATKLSRAILAAAKAQPRADLDHLRTQFETTAFQAYLDRRAKGGLSNDLPAGENVSPGQLFWRQPDGSYGVLAFNQPWWGFQAGAGL